MRYVSLPLFVTIHSHIPQFSRTKTEGQVNFLGFWETFNSVLQEITLILTLFRLCWLQTEFFMLASIKKNNVRQHLLSPTYMSREAQLRFLQANKENRKGQANYAWQFWLLFMMGLKNWWIGTEQLALSTECAKHTQSLKICW